MKTLLLNAPYKDRIIRRFMCSYNSPNFLFPPHELLSLGGILKEWKKGEVKLCDAIAENLNLTQCLERIKEWQPDIIVTLTGFECFQNDIECLQQIKMANPDIKTVAFGYYPTIFAQELLEKTPIDFILFNEPEESFSKLYDCLKEKRDPGEIEGLASRRDGRVYVNKNYRRIANLDELPYPGHHLLNKRLYSEACLGGPFTTISTSRGCPFRCNYCVTSYGHEPYFRSPENVIGEIAQISKLGIRKIRFLDDLFTLKKERVILICKKIIENKFNIEWTALSRVDTLERESLKLMKAAGCRRIYIGAESGSQKILDYYNKGYQAEAIKERVLLVKGAGIEAVGFFIVGSPEESEEDLEKSVKLSREADFDYVIVTKITPYPGTPLFDEVGGSMDFNLLPYKNEFKDKAWEAKILAREKAFYRAFYLRPGLISKRLMDFLKDPRNFLLNAFNFLRFLMSDNSKAKEHRDYL